MCSWRCPMASVAKRRESLTGYPYPSSPAVSMRMKANRSQDTGPELKLRRALHRSGLRYCVNRRLSVDEGRPIAIDIVFPRLKIAVFVDGCFWHGCREHRTLPSSNRTYWEPKIARTIQRDLDTSDRLSRAGWAVVRIWEHEDISAARDRISALVKGSRDDMTRLHVHVKERC